jgi:hypothetical protein
MRLTRSILIAALLGLSSAAFAAAPVDASTREGRMAEARKDYEAKKAGTAVAPKLAVKHVAAKKHHAAAAKPHAKVRHARHAQAKHSHAPAAKAATVAPK